MGYGVIYITPGISVPSGGCQGFSMTKIVILVIVQLCQLGGSAKGIAEHMYTRTAVRKHAFPNIGPKTRFYAGTCMIMRGHMVKQPR